MITASKRHPLIALVIGLGALGLTVFVIASAVLLTGSTTHTARPSHQRGQEAKIEGRLFIGGGDASLGTITVEKESTIEWTNHGFYFAIFTNEGISVNSYAHSGRSVLQAGTYTKFLVNALGSWTINIVPR
jgi:hypothetical protein